MIPAAFDYVKATSVQHATDLLAQGGPEAKVLAGGHSLIPLMRLRLTQPTTLVDVNGLNALSYIRLDGNRLRIGALTRHYQIESSDAVRQNLPLLATMASEVGDTQVRNMGTIGGVLAHADPAGDYGTLALMLDADVITTRRTIPARDFFLGIFTTPLAGDELVTEVAFPVAPGANKYIKFRRRLYDWAIVGAAAQRTEDGWRIGITNAGPSPARATTVEQALAGGATATEAAQHASDGLQPMADLRGSAEYKLHLARVLTQRAIEQAV